MLISMVFNDSLICLPVVDDSGMESVLSDHFRSSEYHFLYDTVSMTWQVVGQTRFEKGCCGSSGVLVKPKLSAVLVHGIGRKAYLAMIKKGVSVWMTKARTVGEALQAWQSGLLVPLLEAELRDHIQHAQYTHYCEKRRPANESWELVGEINKF